MIRSDLYYGVQFAQSLYLLLWQCGRIDEIADRVFAGGNEIEVSYLGETYRGQEAVRGFFGEMQERTRRLGGFYRMDMPAGQHIEEKEDGTAAGYYITMSKALVPSPDGELCCTGIGRFTNRYCEERGIWKLQSVRFELLEEFQPSAATPDRNLEQYKRSPGEYIKDIPELRPLSLEGVTEETAEILSLRNEIFSWFRRFNEGEETQSVFPCRNEAACGQIVKELQSCRYILATSPVIRMNEDLSGAEAFYSASALEAHSADALTDVRGSYFMRLTKKGGKWEIASFSWYPAASLEPWKLNA